MCDSQAMHNPHIKYKNKLCLEQNGTLEVVPKQIRQINWK